MFVRAMGAATSAAPPSVIASQYATSEIVKHRATSAAPPSVIAGQYATSEIVKHRWS